MEMQLAAVYSVDKIVKGAESQAVIIRLVLLFRFQEEVEVKVKPDTMEIEKKFLGYDIYTLTMSKFAL